MSFHHHDESPTAQCRQELLVKTPNTPGQEPQHVLKAGAATPDATDRGALAILSPGDGPSGAGQPAVAGPIDGGRGSDMSLRDYFAAHAPVDVPEWFKHSDETTVPARISDLDALNADREYIGLPEMDQHAVQGLLDGGFLIRPNSTLESIALRAQQVIDSRQRERIAALETNCAARWFAWRWHYASTMIKTRGDA